MRTGVADLEAATREAVAEIAGQVAGTVGIVVPVARRSEVNAWLASWPEFADDAPGARAAVDSSVTPSGDDRIVVLTGLDTKGLEFDGIVVVRPQEIEDESATGRATLYVVLTRATQLLTTLELRRLPGVPKWHTSVMGRTAVILVAVAALIVGFGVGWLVSDAAGGETSDADLACAAAEELPDELDLDDDPSDAEMQERIVVFNRISAAGLLAQAAGQEGPSPNDVDEFGEAGRKLASTVQALDIDGYQEALDDMLDACADR